MSNPNLKPSDRVRVLGVIDPDVSGAGDHSTPWVDLSVYESVLGVVMAGTLGANATLDAKLEQATDGAGAGIKDIADKAITQLTKAAGDDDKQVVINLKSDDLDVNGGFRYVRLTLTVGVANSDAGGLLLGFDARYAPGPAAATLAEVVG